MSLTILATSDVHLGMKFTAYPEVQQELSEARFRCLDRLVGLANGEQCNLLLIAGDLFDRIKTPKEQIVRAARSLNGFEGDLAVVLPGNHDYAAGETSSLWSAFADAAGDRVLLLSRSQPYDLRHYDLEVCLYPGPCSSKHSDENALSWLTPGEARDGRLLHIAVAHGSVEGLSYDSEGVYYPMRRSWIKTVGLDLWIVGHSHSQHPASPSAEPLPLYAPGCPEPDGFDCTHEGKAWILRVDEEKRTSAASVTTGSYRFVRTQRDVSEGATGGAALSPESMLSPFEKADPDRTLLKLTLTGRLPRESRRQLEDQVRQIERAFFWSRIDDSGLAEEITAALVDGEFTEGSFPHRLLRALLEKKDETAARVAYDLLREARP